MRPMAQEKMIFKIKDFIGINIPTKNNHVFPNGYLPGDT